MPPRRATKAATSSSTSTSRSRTARARKHVSPSPPASITGESDGDGEGGFPGESSEEDEVKPKTRRAPAKAKQPAKVARKGARRSDESVATAVADDEEEDPLAGDEEDGNEETRAPPSRRKGVAPKATSGKTVPQKRSSALSRTASDVTDKGGRVDKAPRKSPAAATGSAQAKKVEQAEEEEDDEEEEDMGHLIAPSQRARRADTSPSTKVSTPPTSVASRSVSGGTAHSADVSVSTARGAEDGPEDAEEGNSTIRMPSPSQTSTPTSNSASGSKGPPATPSHSSAGPSGSQPLSQKTPANLAPIAAPKPPKPKPRLTIHKLVLINFKSYAGRQEIGPFHKSFSAIVGPNGSGKSNTIDALLFVFGYKASKLRQGKVSELIHNSAGKEGLESCSVEIWFREIVDLPGNEQFLLVPNSQLVVARTGYRNNSSKYTINERASSYTEVTTLLKGKGIDLDHNRFLILQGEVESIALMKAKAANEHEDGLLEYLEDIIGTRHYQAEIEKANQEVEALNDTRGEKMNRLRVVEREKLALEDSKQEAEQYLRDQNELVRKTSLRYQIDMYRAQAAIEILTRDIEDLTAQLAAEQEQNAAHIADMAHVQEDYDQRLAAVKEVKEYTDEFNARMKRLEKQEVGLTEKQKHLVAKQKKAKKSIADDTKSRLEAMSALDNHAAELETNRVKVDKLEKKLGVEEAELEEIRDSLKDKTEGFTIEIDAKQRELEPWTAKISEKQSAIDVAQSERDLLAKKAEDAKAALAEAKAALEQLKDSGKGKEEEYAALRKELAGLSKQLAAGEDKLQAATAHGDKLRKTVSACRAKADEAKASLVAEQSSNKALNSLNKMKAQGRIQGFHGRLGDLGVIDDKYDVAVTTACGALDNLVVDTVEQGQACIEHVRKENAGRVQIIVLDKLPPRDLDPIETPENVPRLFDLIKLKDARFAPAFYKGLSNTLVAENLEQAKRIGYGKKRWRVVTLGGQLIDPSGTMSGGGDRVKSGGMSSKPRSDRVEPEVVARYEREAASAQQDLLTFQEERKTMEAELAGVRKRIPQLEVEMEKVELDVAGGQKRLSEAQRRLEEVSRQSRPDAEDERRIHSLDADIAGLTKEANKLRETSSTISAQIQDLQEKILEVGGVKLRAIQSKVVTTKGLLDLANESITKAEVGQTKASRDITKLKTALESNKAKLEETETELAAVQTELAGCQSDAALIRDKLREANEASEDVKETLAESKKLLDERQESVRDFKKRELDLKQKIQDNTKAEKARRHELRDRGNKHAELRLEYIDEEEEDEAEDGATGAQAGGEEADGDQTDKPPKRNAESTELVEYSAEELAGVNEEMLTAEIAILEDNLSKGNANKTVLAEYRKREAEYLNRAKDLEDVTAMRDAAKQRHDDTRKKRLDEFMAGFSAISAKLKEMYQMITMGGNAEIELIDSMDPFSEGVVLSIMPPKKSWRAIANLSGGEKTLASLALVFALHVFKPTPLYFMDEIDAALDFKNVSIVANYIQSKTQAAQFIVISLRNDMFELAHRLVGIYKTSNCTKSIAIENQDIKKQAVARIQRPLPSPGPSVRRPSQSVARFSVVATPKPERLERYGTDLSTPAPTRKMSEASLEVLA